MHNKYGKDGFAAISVSFGPAADDQAIIASSAPAKNKAKLAATFT